MRAADIEVAKSEVEAENQAVAGVKETYKLICRDAFGNHAESLEKLKFGVILVPMITNEKTAPKAERNERKSRESLAATQMRRRQRRRRQRRQSSTRRSARTSSRRCPHSSLTAIGRARRIQ